MRSKSLIYILLSISLLCLFVLDLCGGSIWLNPLSLFGDHSHDLTRQILLNLRLPKALTALMAGIGLSVSGLLMQTLFRNPLAGPYTLGVSSGASLGVALVTMCGLSLGIASTLTTFVAAILGAALVLLLVMAVSRRVRSNVSLLIVGMMFGSIAGALVNLIQNFANPDSLKLFIVWTLGSLSNVTWQQIPVLLVITITGMLICLFLMKPLNGMALGEDYARGLGIRVERTRLWIVVATGLLAGGITAYCGPIAFIGVAVPHIARGIFRTSNHRLTLPATALIGANILLLCDFVCSVFTYPLPISTVSALFGAPIIIYIILTHKA
ncbi:MAG: FecCD family ABC transporter permease [Paludibacteraceae bacterium]